MAVYSSTCTMRGGKHAISMSKAKGPLNTCDQSKQVCARAQRMGEFLLVPSWVIWDSCPFGQLVTYAFEQSASDADVVQLRTDHNREQCTGPVKRMRGRFVC